MRWAGFFITLVVLVLRGQTEAQNDREAACRARTSVDGVREIVNAVGPELVDTLVEAELGDVSGRTSITLVGKIDYDLTKLNVASASYSNMRVDLPGKVDFAMEGLAVRVTMDWSFAKVGFPWIPFGSGRAVGDISRSDIQVGISTGINDIGQATAVIDEVSVNLRDVDLTISGSWFSWLYNFLIWVFNGAVKDALTSVIETEVVDELNEVITEMLESIPTTVPVTERLVLDYSLTEAPLYITDPDSVVFSLLGEFHDPINYEPAPFPHADFNEHLPIPGMARIWLDQFILNSFLYTAYKTDSIEVVLRDGEPVDIGFGFNTNDWLLIVPRLPILYPNREIQLDVKAADQPLVQITEEFAELEADVFITFMVEASGGEDNPVFEEAFKIRANMDIALDAALDSTPDQTHLLLELQRAKFDLSLENSNIGDINVNALNAFIQAVFDEIVIPMVNQFLGEGLELPSMPGLVLQNSDIKFHDSYLAIDTDLQYEIPDEIQARVRHKRRMRLHPEIESDVDDLL